MEVYVEKELSDFLKFTNVGGIEEAVLNIEEDHISIDAINRESTLLVYSSMNSSIGIGDRLLGIYDIPILIRALLSVEPTDKDKIILNIEDESIIVSDEFSKYKILLCHPDIITVPKKIKDLDYSVEFSMNPSRILSLLRGMSIIEDPTLSILCKDKKICIVVGVDTSNNYIENIYKTITNKEIELKKVFNKEHVQSILEIHKNSEIKFSIMDKIMRIQVKGEKINVDYFLSPKKEVV